MAKRVRKKILNYTVIFESAEEGGFVVSVPALPGCHTQGETLDEAYKMAKDAILGYIRTIKDLKEVTRKMLWCNPYYFQKYQIF